MVTTPEWPDSCRAQAALLQQLGAVSQDEPASEAAAQGPARALCWAVLRPVCNAMLGCVRRRVPTVAAFVNTIMAPQLFAGDDTQVGWQSKQAQVRWPRGGLRRVAAAHVHDR